MALTEVDQVLGAVRARDLFGDVDIDAAKKVYRRLARAVHPDMFEVGTQKDQASKAFAHLTSLWESLSGGKATAANVVRTKRHEYVVSDVLTEDEVFTRFAVTYDDGHQRCDMLVAKSTRDGDLASAYMSAMRTLKDVPDNYKMYFPTTVEHFRYRQGDGDHAAITLAPLDGFYTLRQVKERYPEGIVGRDIAWIFRRMLVAVGNAHDVGLVHGAPTADAFFIHPEMHGVVLGGWQYSVKTGASLVAVPTDFKNYYPAAALSKSPVDYRLDVHVASKTASDLLRDDQPRALRAFFKGCQVASPPQAKHLLAEFDDLLDRLYGKRSFHQFTMSR